LAAIPLLLVIAVNRDEARRRAEHDKGEIRRQKEIAEANEKTATTREAETRAVLEFVQKRILAAARPKNLAGGLGYQVTLREAVEAALPFVEQSFRGQPLTEARLRITMGTSFWYLGNAKIAADQYAAARSIYTEHLGTDHPDTLLSMINLANSYAALGRLTDALKLREETLALQKTKLGPDHPHTLATMNNLANTYEALGRHAEALKLNEETLALSKAKLGTDHPDTLANMNNLANSYFALGRHAEALKLNEETLALRKAKLGADHPDALLSMNNLANSYAALGRHAEALKLHEETLALRKAKLGADHAETLASMNNLANSYDKLGRHAEALKLREETLALQKVKFGADHPLTLMSMYNIACTQALLVPKSADRARQADLAMDWLKRAVAAGLKDTAQIKADTDLDALRGREDFKKLLAELEAGEGKK
jgi:tetratricopeptide (TPR) repeat protein